MMINKSESILTRVNKVRDMIMDDLKKTKDDLLVKIDECDKFAIDQGEILQASIERTRHYA
jgi:hypothetical protein